MAASHDRSRRERRPGRSTTSTDNEKEQLTNHSNEGGHNSSLFDVEEERQR